jgi:hypothetical protein
MAGQPEHDWAALHLGYARSLFGARIGCAAQPGGQHQPCGWRGDGRRSLEVMNIKAGYGTYWSGLNRSRFAELGLAGRMIP